MIKHLSVAGARGGMKWHCPVEGVYMLVQGCNLTSNHTAQEDAPRPSAQASGDSVLTLGEGLMLTRQTIKATRIFSPQAGIEERDRIIELLSMKKTSRVIESNLNSSSAKACSICGKRCKKILQPSYHCISTLCRNLTQKSPHPRWSLTHISQQRCLFSYGLGT